MKLPTDQHFEKYLLLHFGLLLLAVILLGVVCFFLWKQVTLQSSIDDSLQTQILNLQNQVLRKSPPDTAPPVTDETASWKTYKNSQFGFEIKYPAYFVLDQKDILGVEQTYLLIPSKTISGITDGRINISVNSLLNPPEVPPNAPSSTVDYSEKSGDFIKTYAFLYEGMGGWTVHVFAYQSKDNHVYQINMDYDASLGVPGDIGENGQKITEKEIINRELAKIKRRENEYSKVFDQMLSTFKFTQ